MTSHEGISRASDEALQILARIEQVKQCGYGLALVEPLLIQARAKMAEIADLQDKLLDELETPH